MPLLEFRLRGEFVELNQPLKLTGNCNSGGAGKMLVAAGGVSVDGQVELRKTCKIRAGQIVSLGDVCISVMAAEPRCADNGKTSLVSMKQSEPQGKCSAIPMLFHRIVCHTIWVASTV